jgi:rhodanese-related sulfurtransferase
MGNTYAGNITAATAWSLLSSEQETVLIDVRTLPEWQAGISDLSAMKKKPVLLSWKNAPNYDFNQNFLTDFNKLSLNEDQKILFLCKVGGRSAEAAQTVAAMGYTNCYNIEGGFDSWKSENLPCGALGSVTA